jgi:hypothetical protein
MELMLLPTVDTHKGELILGGSKTALSTNSEVVHKESTAKTDAQEDWLRTATAAPASWLKDIDH